MSQTVEIPTKRMLYDLLVKDRKACRACEGITNPSSIEGGIFDCDEIGAWSLWQGNLDASVMIVGQDWGHLNWFLEVQGQPTSTSRTNTNLVHLLEAAGISIKLANQTKDRGSLFFTNAVLCIKPNTPSGAQSAIRPEWLQNCGMRFLRPLIELVDPKVVICLGENAYSAVMIAFGKLSRRFRDAVNSHQPDRLDAGPSVFPVYHCGAVVSNTHRKFSAQLEDWKWIGKFLSAEKGGSKPQSVTQINPQRPHKRVFKIANYLDRSRTTKDVPKKFRAIGSSGEVYANFSTDRNSRDWADAVQYGFLSGGGNSRNRSAIESLQPGERVWVNVTGYGFVGVGRVVGTAEPAARFKIKTSDNREVPVLSMRMRGNYRKEFVDDPERCEYFVPIRWLDTRPLERGIREKGFFGNQNTVCRSRSDKWRLTIENLKKRLPGFDEQ